MPSYFDDNIGCCIVRLLYMVWAAAIVYGVSDWLQANILLHNINISALQSQLQNHANKQKNLPLVPHWPD